MLDEQSEEPDPPKPAVSDHFCGRVSDVDQRDLDCAWKLVGDAMMVFVQRTNSSAPAAWIFNAASAKNSL